MHLPTEIFGDVIVIHSPDELGADQTEGFCAFVTQAEPRQVVLDMDGTELLDSAGLAALLDCQDQLREQGGDLRVSTASATNRKILEITRLDQQLDVFETVIDGVNSYHSGMPELTTS
jgi:anti-sigma B factor antagonist